MNTSRQRFRLLLEYDGTRYSGWQRQSNVKSIQGALFDAAAMIFADPGLDIQGNGRTDAGVHALRYTAHLETISASLPPATILLRLNDFLPADIVVLAVEPAHPRFHARHSCIGRSYLYRISKRKTAFAKRYAWWIKEHLDTRAMAEALTLFTGMHDFASFAEKQELKKSTKVLINAALLEEDEETVSIRIVGSHFLWKMIRRMVGILVEIGLHQMAGEEIPGLLAVPSSLPARFTAPPCGLFFDRAFYEAEAFENFLAQLPLAPPIFPVPPLATAREM